MYSSKRNADNNRSTEKKVVRTIEKNVIRPIPGSFHVKSTNKKYDLTSMISAFDKTWHVCSCYGFK